ncbi:hypothetical protein DSO57_1020449 [Entomophthora muscae]|uniref:Uncharacterized protein n=1 Tax=Entomophthora muscae TaxID=34485 RepID=A0ACC2SGD2_9FUNG|nr:hypothetical protein DSO57_1020449 [Entomophthora muscae]
MDSSLQSLLIDWKASLLGKITGLDSTINDLFYFLEYGLVHQVIKGVALLGAPGIGKSFLSTQLTNSAPIKCQLINCARLLGESTQDSLGTKLRDLIYCQDSPRIVILDDLDVLFSGSSPKALGWITKWLSEPYSTKNNDVPTFMIGVTNNPSCIPRTWLVSGRLSGRLEIRENSHLRRASIIQELLLNFVSSPEPSLKAFSKAIASITPSLTPGDLKSLTYKVLANECFSEVIAHKKNNIVASEDVLHHVFSKLEELFLLALKSFIPAGLKAGLNQMSRPKQTNAKGNPISLADVYGLEDIVAELQRSLITPMRQHSSGIANPLSVPRGILLHGPPGVGKTLLCQALGEVLEGNMVFVESTSLRSSFVGASEKAIADMFEQARQNAPCVLCLDQLDALLPPRSTLMSQEGGAERIVTSFLTELDGLFAHDGGPIVVLLGITNRPTHIDPAVLRPGRLDIHLQIPLPNISQRIKIIRGKLGHSNPLDEGHVERMAQLTEGRSGADLENIIQEAALSVLRSNPDAHKVPLEAYIEAIHSYKGTLSQ